MFSVRSLLWSASASSVAFGKFVDLLQNAKPNGFKNIQAIDRTT